MNIIQFENQHQQRAVGIVENNTVKPVNQVETVRDLALMAIENKLSLEQQIKQLGFASENYDYAQLLDKRQVLPPLDHPDTAHCFVSGTGLTHLGSASTRDKMHQQNSTDTASVTDTMRIFQLGIEKVNPLKVMWVHNLNGFIKETVLLWFVLVQTYRCLTLQRMVERSLKLQVYM